MKNPVLLCVIALALALSACQDFYRNLEEPYMRPGALDMNTPNTETAYSRRRFKFLGKYMVSHEWLRLGCHHGSLPAELQVKGQPTDLYAGSVYEKDGNVWQESLEPNKPYNINRYVRSIKVHQPIYGPQGLERYEDQEQGLQAMCFQAWVGTSHTLVLRLHKQDVATRRALWSEYNPSGKWSQRQMGSNFWWVLENDEKDLRPVGTGGWFKSYLAPIGDTDYSISLQLGASQTSLRHPLAHAAMQALFERLVESVKIEPLTPAIETELAQLKAKAEEIQRQECIDSAKTGKPFVWCKSLGIQ